MFMKAKVTWEMIKEQTEILSNMINNLEDGKSDAAEYVCFEMAIQGGYNHYESVGILTEALFKYRNRSIEVLEEDGSEGICSECCGVMDENGCTGEELEDEEGCEEEDEGNQFFPEAGKDQ